VKFHFSNFVVDAIQLHFPDVLFAERIDMLAERPLGIRKKGSDVNVVQSDPMLRVSVEWDADTWRITEDEMSARFIRTIERISETG
jgi:hypothetical protein